MKSIKQNGVFDGDFLTLAPPATTSICSSSKFNHPQSNLIYCELPDENKVDAIEANESLIKVENKADVVDAQDVGYVVTNISFGPEAWEGMMVHVYASSHDG
ncbi:hypothetical protein REPUB_Repub08aG0051800 [Reevesia pubescens]